jgi:hypothetical protein
MKKFQFVFLFAFVTKLAFAAAEPKELPPLDPTYMGEHGLVLMNNSSAIYAANLTKYQHPDNVQLLYKLEVKDLALVQMVKDADLVTVKPEPFNLQRLIRAEKFTVMADVYLGNYQRDGLLTYENVPIVFDLQVYVRSLDNIETSNNRQKYDAVELRNNQRILVHQIQTAPSYAQLILLTDNVTCVTNFNTSSPVPSQGELYNKLTFCGSMKPLYFDIEDFK